ncbi:hypothetical protein [Nocardiopsis tropica]|uniref:Uncharacterized protein n=1 Tax=Nocardiopsis tropica TaxID=109330 RepID=A0ABU7KQW7_9ACTN|nr:hypothetical protein [Nocardiopsis umidischolae]MEE2051686.1 hypothetical protein [Nocardiopsis umidischolae]
MNNASGGHVHPTDHGDDVPALLSTGYCRTDMTLIARIGVTDYELGEMTLDVPVHPGKEQPWTWEVGDIEPTLAAALREAADEIENPSPEE